MIKSLFLILICYCFSLIEAEICVRDCSPLPDFPLGNKLQIDESATAKALTDAANRVIKNSIKCLYPNIRACVENYLNNHVLNIQLICPESSDSCAEAWDPLYGKNFNAIAWNLNFYESDCGCNEALILHEILHLATDIGNEGHSWIYPCAKDCTSQFKACKLHPPDNPNNCKCKDIPNNQGCKK